MEDIDNQIYAIIVPDADDYQTGHTYVEALNPIYDFLPNIIQGDTLLACFAKVECIDIGHYISYQASQKNMNFNSLALYGFEKPSNQNDESKNHAFVTSNQISYLQILKNNADFLLESLKLSIKNEGNTLIIGNSEIFSLIRNNFNSREFGPLKFGTLSFNENQSFELPRRNNSDFKFNDEKMCEELYLYLKNKPIIEILKSKAADTEKPDAYIRKLDGILAEVQNFVKNLSIQSSSSANVSESLLNKIEKEASVAKEQVEACADIIKYAVDMKNTFTDPKLAKSQESYLELRKFYFNQELGKFKIQIENPTEFDYFNVTVFILELGEEICHLSLVEKNSKVWKETEFDYRDDWYGLHLVVISQNELVLREPYYISKCKLSIEACGEEELVEGSYPKESSITYKMKLKNYSNDELADLYLNTPERVKGLKFLATDYNYDESPEFEPDNEPLLLKYGESATLTFRATYNFDDPLKSLSENYRIFVCSNSNLVSNTIHLNQITNYED